MNIIKLIAQNDHEKIMRCVSKNLLSYEEEVALIMRGNHEEIMEYLSDMNDDCSLSDEAEVPLIMRGNHEEIVEYVSCSVLSDAGEIALIMRGDHEEIMKYLEYLAEQTSNNNHEELCEEAKQIIRKRGNKEEIKALKSIC